MGAIWPFYALLPIFLARLWPRQQKRILLTISGVVLLSGILFTIQTIRTNQRMPDNTVILATAGSILIDTVERGIAPRLYWPIPDDTAVFIAPQAELPALQSRWLSQLPNGAIYINDLEYDNNENGRDQILAILRQRFEVVPVPGGVWGLGQIYLLLEKERQS
jgi:4-amino-4-deoxy-L-arabinose transferase-like glycosyltransferase